MSVKIVLKYLSSFKLLGINCIKLLLIGIIERFLDLDYIINRCSVWKLYVMSMYYI